MANEKAATEVLSRKLYPAGQVIFRAEDVGVAAYLVRSGSVEIYKLVDGQEISLAVLQPGELFGEMALFNAGRRSTFARAKTPSELVSIQGGHVERLMEEADPAVKALVRVLVRRMNDLNQRIEVCPVTGKFRIAGDPGGAEPTHAHA